MKRRKLGPLDAVVCGGVDREGGGDGPVVVLLHGFGAPGEDLVSLWRVIEAPSFVRWVFPAAPLDLSKYGYPGDARAWWLIDMERIQRMMVTGRPREMAKEVPPGLAAARAALSELLAEVERAMSPSALVLGGFSQGAMLSLDLALRARPKTPLVLLSGTIICEDEWDPLIAEHGKELRVFQSHGREDPLLPFVIAEELHGKLTRAGASAELVPFRGGHEIPSVVLGRLSTYLRGVTSGA